MHKNLSSKGILEVVIPAKQFTAIYSVTLAQLTLPAREIENPSQEKLQIFSLEDSCTPKIMKLIVCTRNYAVHKFYDLPF